MPLALMNANVRAVMTAVVGAWANQEFPGPSGPEGHNVTKMLLNCGSRDEGDPETSADCRGIGTSEDVKAVAPEEGGRLGLLELTMAGEPSPAKALTNEPAKKRLDPAGLVVMEFTWAEAPANPPKGGPDQEDAVTSQMATEVPGEVKWPPAHTLAAFMSQNTAFI